MECEVAGTKTFTKTIDPVHDYHWLAAEIASLENLHKQLTIGGQVRVDLGHPHRFWEYGMAMRAWKETRNGDDAPRVLEVGSGRGLLGAALAMSGARVVQVEPDATAYGDIVKLNVYLALQGMPEIKWLNRRLEETRLVGQYEAVFCVSVIEHVDREEWFLKRLAEFVAEGGLLFLTTDAMTDPGKPHVFDNLRRTNYSLDLIRRRAESLLDDFEFLTPPDWTYHGDFIHDYTFCSLAMRRKC